MIRGDVWYRADGSESTITILDIDTYSHCNDIVVRCNTTTKEYRLDVFKLNTRYTSLPPGKLE